MMIFWQAGLVVLAVPKTGSEALQEALWPHADMGVRFPPFYRHMNAAWFDAAWARVLRAEDRARLHSVAVVREPVDWLSSWYRYRLRDDIAGHPTSTRGIGFADFVTAWLDDAPPAFAQIGRQSRFCSAQDGRVVVDHLFAYEAPDALHGFLETRLARSVKPERRNVSPKVETPLPAALHAQLRAEAAADFALHARAQR